jgi:hypothetical protein
MASATLLFLVGQRLVVLGLGGLGHDETVER